MEFFELMEKHDHEQVVFCCDKKVGLNAIIAIHDTTLGPALGGLRMWNYKTVEDGFKDVLRLARGMTYKAAAAGLNLGGGKAVIIGDPEKDKSEALFRTFGRFVDSLGGRYITAEDVNTAVYDMEFVRMETQYVTGISRALGGSGDPSPVTALGTYCGIKACVKEAKGTDSLAGVSVAVQGAGAVGYYLIELLSKEGAKIYVTDIDKRKIERVSKEFKIEYVNETAIFDVDADVFAPCALGAILNDETIPRLKFKIIAGAANNQLADEVKHGQMVHEKGILYAPDYVINAGGLINVYNEIYGYNREKALNEARNIYNIVKKVIDISKAEKVPTNEASNRMAERRIEEIGRLKRRYGKVELTLKRENQ